MLLKAKVPDDHLEHDKHIFSETQDLIIQCENILWNMFW